jgi:hypothetical protein
VPALLPPITKDEPIDKFKQCSTQLFAASLQRNDAYVRFKVEYSEILGIQLVINAVYTVVTKPQQGQLKSHPKGWLCFFVLNEE